MDSKRKKILITGVILLVLIIIAGVITSQFSGQNGSVTLSYSALPDIHNVKVQFNNKSVAPAKESKNTYTLAGGSYKLTVAKPGYKKFSTSFNLHAGQKLLITVNLKPAAMPKLSAIQQIVSPSSKDVIGFPPNTRITKKTYFNNKTWAVVKIVAYGDDMATMVLRYNAAPQTWSIALGPGTSFTSQNIKNLPVNIQQYMTNNNLVTGG